MNMKKYFLFFVVLTFTSVMLIGCQTAVGPTSSQVSASPSQQAQTNKSRYCLVSDDEATIIRLGNRKQTSCDPAVVARYVIQYGSVIYWEFLNDQQIKTTVVYDPKYLRFGTKENPYIKVEAYQKNGNIFVQGWGRNCKKTYEIFKENSDSITLINRGVSSSCDPVIIKQDKGLLNKAETYRKVYY